MCDKMETLLLLLNRMRVGDHTPEDIEFIKTLADTDTENWPESSCKLCMTKRLVIVENEEHTINDKVIYLVSIIEMEIT